jgi:hypothetical protein
MEEHRIKLFVILLRKLAQYIMSGDYIFLVTDIH